MAKWPVKCTKRDSHILTLGGLRYDVYQVIHLAKDIKPIEMEAVRLESKLIRNCWTDSHEQRFSPLALLRSYWQLRSWKEVGKKHPTWIYHINKVMLANCRFPVLVCRDKVVDGTHRVIHARAFPIKTLRVRVLKHLPRKARYYGK